MFFKGSRYKRLKDEITQNAEGRVRKSKELRFTKDVAGTFIHYLSAVDRLDHLAHKYYKHSKKWWRICDANQEYLSPLALLGQEPVENQVFFVSYNNPLPAPLPQLIKILLKKNGVRDIQIKRKPSLQKVIETHDGEEREILTEIDQYEITVHYHSLIISSAKIENQVLAHDFMIEKKYAVSRIGKPVNIPSHTLE